MKLGYTTMILSLAMAALQGCQDAGSPVDPSSPDQARQKDGSPGMVCIQVVVCGADGKLYSDPCAADAAKVKYGYDLAACKEPVTIEPMPGTKPVVTPIGDDMGACTADYAPVCGADSKTYSNACEATSHKATIAHTGVCP